MAGIYQLFYVCRSSSSYIIATWHHSQASHGRSNVICAYECSSHQRDALSWKQVIVKKLIVIIHNWFLVIIRPGRKLASVRRRLELQIWLECGNRSNIYSYYQNPLLNNYTSSFYPPLYTRNVEREVGDASIGYGQVSLSSLWSILFKQTSSGTLFCVVDCVIIIFLPLQVTTLYLKSLMWNRVFCLWLISTLTGSGSPFTLFFWITYCNLSSCCQIYLQWYVREWNVGTEWFSLSHAVKSVWVDAAHSLRLLWQPSSWRHTHVGINSCRDS